MVPTVGCWARDEIGAAFAGVFCGVLVGCLLDLGTSMTAIWVESLCGRVSGKTCRGAERDLRSRDGVHLLIADRFRHLGRGSVVPRRKVAKC